MEPREEVAVAVAHRVGIAFARGRSWVEVEDAISEATVACLEALPGYDQSRGPDIGGFLGQLANWRLIDWQRRERRYAVRTTRVDEGGIARRFFARTPWAGNTVALDDPALDDEGRVRPSSDEPGYIDPGFALVDALDFHRRLVAAREAFAGDEARWSTHTRNARMIAAGHRTRIVKNHVVVEGALLTKAERWALRGAARGETNDETARLLGKSTETVKSQKRMVLAKLGARNMTHAVALAFASDLLTAGDIETREAA